MKQPAAWICSASAEGRQSWPREEPFLVSASWSLPLLPDSLRGKPADRFRRYYAAQQRAMIRWCETVLLPRAKAAQAAALAVSAPFSPLEAALRWQLTLCRPGLVSLWTERTVRSGGRAVSCCRWGDTWNTETGFFLPLEACFPRERIPEKQLLRLLESQASARQRAGLVRWCADYRKALHRRFDPLRFFLTEEALVLFYPQAALAPAKEGISLFSIPYSDSGPLLPDS